MEKSRKVEKETITPKFLTQVPRRMTIARAEGRMAGGTDGLV